MPITGGCYCKGVRYEAGAASFKAICFCRECQQIAGGNGNMFMIVSDVVYTKGAPKQFKRADLPNPVTREFCPECGTHLVTRTPNNLVVLKVGSLDNPADYGAPQAILYTSEMQPFHTHPDVAMKFEKLPG